tara:strand:+ start:8879 stop:9934 length:1056 start_codon:yes stop_codon:yes gene_type:complete
MSEINTTPLVSICIPTYNGAKYIEETIECAINQTYQNIEIIISDDQSTDNTLKICNSFALKDDRIKVFQNKHNIGLVGNWCEVINKTSKESEWIKFLFQDDLMNAATVEKMVDCAISSNVDFVLTNRQYFFEKDISNKTKDDYGNVKKTGKIFTESRKYSPAEVSKLITPYIFHNCLGEPPCTLFKKDKFTTTDFPLDMPQMVDYVFNLNKILEGDFYFLNELLVKFRVHNNSQTNKNTSSLKKSTKNILRLVEIHFYEKLKICHLILNNSKFKHINEIMGEDNISCIKQYIFYRSYYKNKGFHTRISNLYRSSNLNSFIFNNCKPSFIFIKYKIANYNLKARNLRIKYDI